MEIKKITNEFLGETYYRIDHTSGLTFYVMPKENYKSTYAIFGTDYGSVDTSFAVKGQQAVTVPEGIAHFLEHKLFESEELDAFERYAKTGASANAYTSFDKTCYLFSCSDNFKESFEILLDFVKHPYFTQQTVEKEQGIIGQEIKMYQDNPDWQVLFNLLKAAYRENPVRIDIAGTVDSIAKINADLLYKCYGTFYNNSNMVLAVVGNVSVDDVLEVADRVLKNEEKVQIERIIPHEPDTVQEHYVEEDMHVQISKFNLGFRERAENKADIGYNVAMGIALDIICGKTTDFYDSLLKKELINSYFGKEHFFGRGFEMTIFSGESKDPEAVRELICERIKYLKDNGIDENEFEALRRRKYGTEVKCLNDIEALANGFVSMHFDGLDLFDAFEVYREIKKEDVEKIIRDSFDENQCVLSVIK